MVRNAYIASTPHNCLQVQLHFSHARVGSIETDSELILQGAIIRLSLKIVECQLKLQELKFLVDR